MIIPYAGIGTMQAQTVLQHVFEQLPKRVHHLEIQSTILLCSMITETNDCSQLLNSAAIFILGQGALILQPTHTPEQKRNGTISHAAINNVALATFLAGLVIIEVNKIGHNGKHSNQIRVFTRVSQ
jgi:hypothetical protein